MWPFSEYKQVISLSRSTLPKNAHPSLILGVYDPALIGDKPKWYSRNLTSIPFNIIEANSTLGQAISLMNSKLNEVEHTASGTLTDTISAVCRETSLGSNDFR